MKIKYLFILFFLLLSITVSAQDIKTQIKEVGENEWNRLLANLKNKKLMVEGYTADKVIADFQKFSGKYMILPQVSPNNLVMDSFKVKYYISQVKAYEDFLVKYDEKITEITHEYVSFIEDYGSAREEILGIISDYSKADNKVFIQLIAYHIEDVLTIKLEQTQVQLVGQNILEREIMRRQIGTYNDIPPELLNLTTTATVDDLILTRNPRKRKEVIEELNIIPSDLKPLLVAKLFFYIGNVLRDKEVWMQLLSTDWSEAKIKSIWRLTSNADWEYFFVKTAKDAPTSKIYYFQRIKNGKREGGPRSISVDLQNKEWKVTSASP